MLLAPSLMNPLTDRQTEILQCLADGLICREIATKLGVTEITIKNHSYNLKQRIGVPTAAAAVAEGIRYMWVV